MSEDFDAETLKLIEELSKGQKVGLGEFLKELGKEEPHPKTKGIPDHLKIHKFEIHMYCHLCHYTHVEIHMSASPMRTRMEFSSCEHCHPRLSTKSVDELIEMMKKLNTPSKPDLFLSDYSLPIRRSALLDEDTPGGMEELDEMEARNDGTGERGVQPEEESSLRSEEVQGGEGI